MAYGIVLLGVRCRFMCDGGSESLGKTVADEIVQYEDIVSSNIRNDMVIQKSWTGSWCGRV